VQAELFSLFRWVENHPLSFWWIGALSAAIFLIFLIAIPLLIVKLPYDFFIRQSMQRPRLASHNHPAMKLIYMITKNLVGVMIIFAGIVMLFLPGQGIITIIVGLSLLNIPGKRRLVLYAVCHSFIMRPVNRLRARFDKPAFLTPECWA